MRLWKLISFFVAFTSLYLQNILAAPLTRIFKSSNPEERSFFTQILFPSQGHLFDLTQQFPYSIPNFNSIGLSNGEPPLLPEINLMDRPLGQVSLSMTPQLEIKHPLIYRPPPPPPTYHFTIPWKFFSQVCEILLKFLTVSSHQSSHFNYEENEDSDSTDDNDFSNDDVNSSYDSDSSNILDYGDAFYTEPEDNEDYSSSYNY